MSSYKLPDILGGGVVKVLHGMAREDDLVDCVLSDGSHLVLPLRRLTKVEDPLPEEPPVGSVVRAQLVDEDEPWMWQRTTPTIGYGAGWYAAGLGMCFEWAALCTRGTPVLLVPAPEPVELPWRGESNGTRPIAVTQRSINTVRVDVGRDEGFNIEAATARDMARALWTAADRSES